MTLLRPEWLLLWPLVIWQVWRWHRGAGQQWQQHIDAPLLSALMRQAGGRRTRWRRRTGLGALLLLPLALVGPALERPTDDGLQERPVVIILDQSPTMLARDIPPNRHTRARQKVQDWMEAHPGRPMALVTYSGSAHVVTPLTFDHHAVDTLLRQLDPEIMPRPGNHPVAALTLANDLLGDQAGDILWLTAALSAEQRTRLPELATSQRQLGIIAVGTDIGGPLLRQDGTPVRDGTGNPVEHALDPAEFSILADAGNIRWHTLTADDTDWQSVLPPSPLAEGTGGEDSTVTVDLGLYLLLALLPGLALLFGRGQLVVVLLAVGLWLPAPPASAEPADWFRSPDQQGAARLPTDPEAAMHLFHSRDWQIYAALEAGAWQQALQWLGSPETARDHYHRGNALVHLERYEEALEAYEAALEQEPDFAEAEHNRDLVEVFLQQQAETGGAEQSSPQAPAQPGDGSARAGDGAPTQPGDGSGDAGAADDGAQALEDSIRRRMPETDASLLQRKFRHQYEADPDNIDDTGPLW